jgi:uridine kinase
VFGAPVGTPLGAYCRAAEESLPEPVEHPALAAIVDGHRLRELSYPVTRDIHAEPINGLHPDGARIYRRSLTFLLVAAAAELFPDHTITIDHSVPDGGYYGEVTGRDPFTEDELKAIKTRMQEIVAADEPIIKKQVPLEEARAMFEARGADDKLRLLEARESDFLVTYTLRGYTDYYYGYMLPSTGYLKLFDLMKVPDGFILRFPTRRARNTIHPYAPSPKIFEVFRRASEWLGLLGIDDIGRLNRATESPDRIREIILIAEALHERHIAQMASDVAAQHRESGVRLVTIAGPSSSGKTTFAKRLAIQLSTQGLRPFTIELDNYFVPRRLTPLDENGDYDYENVHAVDIGLFNEQLVKLMAGDEVRLSRYDFIKGDRAWAERPTRITPEHIIIVEGIHGLNPELLKEVPAAAVYRIYCSALTQLNIDRHNRVPTTDVRLIRRIVRDYAYRGYSAQDTIERWESVRKGEKKWIFPFQENADQLFNSSLAYELTVLRPLVEPLLRQVDPQSGCFIEANRLLAFLRWVHPLSPDKVPGNSLLREFVGGLVLADYIPGDGRDD